MYLSILQLIAVSIANLLIGSLIGYQFQNKKINKFKKELRIKDASLKGMWSAQEKKQKNKRLDSNHSSNNTEVNPSHVSDVYQANG